LVIHRLVEAAHGRIQVLLRALLGAQVGVDFGAPTPGPALQHVRVMEQAVEERGDGGGVAQQFTPVIDGTV